MPPAAIPALLALSMVLVFAMPAAGVAGQDESLPSSASRKGRVERVVDGDGLRVRLGSRTVTLRLYGIDAPELSAPQGRRARSYLEGLCAGQAVEITPVSRDSYGRMVALVHAGGTQLNEAMLAGGHAWAYRQYLGQVPGDERYCELEAEARAAGLGLWSRPSDQWLPPWIYRARARGERGERVASRDYSAETARDCLAATRNRGREAHGGRSGAQAVLVAGPSGDACPIKGNISRKGERIYHLPGSDSYESTRIDSARGERWFCSEEEAREAGWRAPR